MALEFLLRAVDQIPDHLGLLIVRVHLAIAEGTLVLAPLSHATTSVTRFLSPYVNSDAREAIVFEAALVKVTIVLSRERTCLQHSILPSALKLASLDNDRTGAIQFVSLRVKDIFDSFT